MNTSYTTFMVLELGVMVMVNDGGRNMMLMKMMMGREMICGCGGLFTERLGGLYVSQSHMTITVM